MVKNHYFTISSHPTPGSRYILRLVVQRDEEDALIDHYYEYGKADQPGLILSDSAWSSDPEALVGEMPLSRQFHASMDIRHFLRTDLDDALDGSLLSEEFEIMV
ncbi:MAG: hypothetical protein QM690_00430 [Sphingobium sp.]